MADTQNNTERDKRLSIPVTAEEKQEFRVRAAQEGTTMSKLARRILYDRQPEKTPA